MTVREQLNQELAQAPDALLEEVLDFLRSKQTQVADRKHDNSPQKQSVLERMGGVPKHLLTNGNLSDRDQRRATIAKHLQERRQHQQP